MDDTLDASPSLDGSSFLSNVGKDESIEYCRDVAEDSCKVEAANSSVALVEDDLRKEGCSFVTELDPEPTRDVSFEAGGERRVKLGGVLLLLPGSGSHTRISIMSPTCRYRFDTEGADGKLVEFKIGGLPSSVLPASKVSARESLLL
jgi:hypothetical protein